MHDRLRAAFAAVEAEEELKAKTRAYLIRKTHGYKRRSVQPGLVRCAAGAACVLLFVLLGAGLFFTPVSAISIDINPSLELNMNCFDRVVSIRGFNEDGKQLAERMQVQFMGYTAALAAVLADESIQSPLAEGEALSIYVACDDAQRGDEMLAQVQNCARQQGKAHCQAGDWDTEEAAQASGLSCGRYRAFLELQALDPTVTPEDVQGLTMREIRARIAELSRQAPPSGQAVQSSSQQPDSSSQAASPQPACGQGNGHGQGHGHGKHRGQGGRL